MYENALAQRSDHGKLKLFLRQDKDLPLVMRQDRKNTEEVGRGKETLHPEIWLVRLSCWQSQEAADTADKAKTACRDDGRFPQHISSPKLLKIISKLSK